jgi:hypothetical protein
MHNLASMVIFTNLQFFGFAQPHGKWLLLLHACLLESLLHMYVHITIETPSPSMRSSYDRFEQNVKQCTVLILGLNHCKSVKIDRFKTQDSREVCNDWIDNFTSDNFTSEFYKWILQVNRHVNNTHKRIWVNSAVKVTAVHQNVPSTTRKLS